MLRRSRNLIGPYHFWGISPRNSTLFTRPFLAGRHVWDRHETRGGKGRMMDGFHNHFISLCQCFEVAQKMNNELLESVKEMTLVGLALCIVSKLLCFIGKEIIYHCILCHCFFNSPFLLSPSSLPRFLLDQEDLW